MGDLTDPEVEAAATKIQAGFKGHKTRKEMKNKMADSEASAPAIKETIEEEKKDAKEEEIDIDLTDPEVEAAATKIQAGFKGHKTRKEMKAKESSAVEESATLAEEDDVVDIDLN